MISAIRVKVRAATAISILTLVFVSLLSGCVTIPAENLTQADSGLSKNEGILVTKIRTNISHGPIFIHEKGQKWPIAQLLPIKAPEELRVIKIKSGEAYFSKIFLDNSYVWGNPIYFIIEPGTINYPGDFVVQWESATTGISIHALSLLIDREQETMAQARKEYPWLFNVYPYKKIFPEQRPKSDELKPDDDQINKPPASSPSDVSL